MNKLSTQLSKFRTLQLLKDPTLSIDVSNSDPSLTYRLLRLLNTAAFGFSMKITSIRHAIVLMGIRRLKYRLRIVVLKLAMSIKSIEKQINPFQTRE
jgi:EAL and modified HD-GYP domain-containing signal transduction protein